MGKKLAVTLADELDPKTRTYLANINVQAGETLEAGEVLFTTRLYDIDEMRRFERGRKTQEGNAEQAVTRLMLSVIMF